MKTEAQAIGFIARVCEASAEPVISTDDVADLVRARQRWIAYAAGTAYNYGDRVYIALNGRLYKCVVGGTSAATAPQWPVNDQSRKGRRVTDNDITWSDDGEAYAEQFDLLACRHDMWLAKAEATAILMDVSNGSDKIALSQRHEHFLTLAKRFTPVYVV